MTQMIFNKRYRFHLLALLVAALLTGCAMTTTVQSKAFIRPPEKFRHLRLIYIEHSVTNSPNGSHYDRLPELIGERALAIFAQSKVSVAHESVKRSDMNPVKFSEIMARRGAPPGSMVLLLEFSDGSVVQGSRTPRTVEMNFNALLAEPDSTRLFWDGKFRATFVMAPGVDSGFNDKTVDDLLDHILDRLIKDGMAPPKSDPQKKPSSPLTHETSHKPIRSHPFIQPPEQMES